MEWKAVYYNGLETNIEVTKCGKVKRVKKDWYGLHINSNNMKYDEIDFSKLKLGRGYKILTIQIKGMHRKSVYVHQLIASAFLGYNFKGHKNIVDHIDTDILNNNINNLRVITNRENTSKESG